MKNKPFYKNGEFYLSLFFLAVFAVLLSSVGSIRHAEARIWPCIVLVPFGLSSLALLVMSLGRTWTDVSAFKFSKKELIAVAAMLAAAFLESYIGLLPALFLLSIAINLLIQGVPSWKALVRQLLFSVLLIAVCYLVFDLWLEMYLPAGSLFQ